MSSYRETFANKGSAENYDDHVYQKGSIADIQWRAERELLDRTCVPIIAALKTLQGDVGYLDFACGTGRIISYLEALVDTATGIDISRQMLDLAEQKVETAKLIQKDVTDPLDEVEGQYDLVTSFRFMANSENDLRRAALLAIAKRMKNENSILLINNHGNPFSYRAFFLPFHWIRDRAQGRSLYGYYTNASMKRLLNECGFQVDHIIGYGFVPGKLLPLLPNSLALWLEKSLAGKPLVNKFGVTQLFVCRKSAR